MFLDWNATVLAGWTGGGNGGDGDGGDALAPAAVREVVTFSHFVPRFELYRGFRGIVKVVGCPGIDTQARAAGSTLHVFGHTHLQVNTGKRGGGGP